MLKTAPQWTWLITIAFLALTASATGPSSAVIEFEDAPADGAIDDFYVADYGLTFTKAKWLDVHTTVPGMSGTVLIVHTETGTLPKSDNPIVGTFAGAKSMVSIAAIEPGENGARLDVYDAVTGGNLIGSAECVLAVCYAGSNSNGTGVFDTLTVEVAGIRRFELYQPRSTAGNLDGIQWDNLCFEPIERFTTSDFGPPMGKKKKLGSIIPVRFRLFFDGNGVTSQAQLDSALSASGHAVGCPRILIADITDGDDGVNLPEDLDDSVSEADDSDCFQYEDGNWILKLRLGSQFQAGRTYRVQVELSDCLLTPQNNTFQTK